MLTKFWDKMGEELAGRWAGQVIGPALAFWGGGLLTWAWSVSFDWQRATGWIQSANTPTAYAVLALCGLFILTASTALVEWLQEPVLRILEGYWPWPLRWLRFTIAGRRTRHVSRLDERWQDLVRQSPEKREPKDLAEFVRLDARLATFPLDPQRMMPTRLGNILRSAEDYAHVRYGLSTSICWPRLWLALPEETQETVSLSRKKLNTAVHLFTWGLLFLAWTVFAWWAVAVSLATMLIAYVSALQAAAIYGELLRSTFDLYRFDLYEQVKFPLPKTVGSEVAAGNQLSEYLFRGTSAEKIAFEHGKEKEDDT
jgi:hypothetical protein